ncbi:ATP-dependent zinc metalloprotease FTSH mitochondrial isoform A [Micractinium conductrix]|uniref:ATP-dependent zinc metalloprotease FTSH mitochondrial isoform A n=1 Tax=Micractinium conductrix TaxID=554055 RepID=A0A2P6VQQ6_9CHLO|nr:ATP-dependent zinc metalloprotease FTSH mitochondrial isoform A [Micractinium conductrix]|eukprot:PSC76419.1 ATP-dependent zinc metalloprotease FTSH mitochondrial isoform A [Micractinium conductrix]
MGRVWREDRVLAQLGGGHLQQGLVRSAAARESGLGYEEFDARLQHLLALMPFLTNRLPRLAPKLVAALVADPPTIAARLVELKRLLPAADVAAIAGGRPSLLVPPEWERLPAGVAALQARYSEEEVARLAAAEPLLLADDVEAVLAELQRLAGGGDAAAVLLTNPSLVYSVQRGTGALGPGAEFL